MENEEEEIDFEELSKEYPLFFSSSKNLIKEKYYPSPKSPKPITDSPEIFLDYDDYMLDERISNLQFYPVDSKSNDSSSKRHSSKSRPNSRNSNSSNTNTETALSQSALKNTNSSNKQAITSKKISISSKQSNQISNINSNEDPILAHDSSRQLTKLNLNDIDDSDIIHQDFKETGVQTPKNIIKKRFNNPPPPPAQTALHSGYPLFFDYQPIHPQRHQKLQNGTEKIFYKNGDIFVRYVSGKEKIYHQNIILTKYKNGDILQEFLDGATGYRYANTGTIELTLPDRTSIIQYSNGQREKRTPEGETIVKFSDGVFMKVDSEGKWTMVKSKT